MEKSKGLGDTIEKITKKTGIKKAVNLILGDKCGCEERKNKLNNLFPYRTINCLNENEYLYLDEFFKTKRSTLTYKEQIEMINIMNRVFDTNQKPSTCSSCVKELYNTIKRLYENYERT